MTESGEAADPDELIRQLRREVRILRKQLDTCQEARAQREDMHEADIAMRDALLAERDQAERERDATLAKHHRAVEAERKRISADLHDLCGQTITATQSYAALIRKLLKEFDGEHPAVGKIDRYASEIGRFTALLTDATRVELKRLWPESIDREGLDSALEEYIESWRRSVPSMRVATELDAVPPFQNGILVYRIATEWLTNVSRHATAQSVSVRLGVKAPGGTSCPWGHLQITDDGVGFASSEPGNEGRGLLGIRERARTIRAHLDIDSRPGEGARLNLRFPIRAGEVE